MIERKYLIWYRCRGFLIFLFFSFFTFFTSFVIKKLNLKFSPLLVMLLVDCLSFIFFIFFQSKRYLHFNFFSKFPIKSFVKFFVIGIIMYFVSMFAVYFSLTFLTILLKSNLPSWFTAGNDGFSYLINSPNIFTKICWIFVIVIVAPFIEELIFRGYLQDTLFRVLRINGFDIFITSFIFAIFHVNSFANMIFALVVGISLSYFRKKEHNLFFTFFIHASVNLTSLIIGLSLLKFIK